MKRKNDYVLAKELGYSNEEYAGYKKACRQLYFETVRYLDECPYIVGAMYTPVDDVLNDMSYIEYFESETEEWHKMSIDEAIQYYKDGYLYSPETKY